MICGGPMYAMERGMNNKFLAVLFAIFTLGACTGIGSMTQSNAVASFAQEVFSIPCWLSGGLETLLIIAVVVGGVKVVSKVCGTLVPFMAILYVGCCIVILFMNGTFVLPALKLILKSAFSTEAVSGGFFGSMIMLAMRYGIARGLFSNESGLGSAPLIAASAKTTNPVRQALISSTGTFWDTVCVCAITGVTIVSAMLFNYGKCGGIDFSKFQAQELTKAAFNLLPFSGLSILTIALAIFACTTVLGWFCYGEQAIHYLGGKKALFVYRLIFIAAVYFGAVTKLEIVWNFSDIANGLMAIPNIISLFVLHKVIAAETKRYLHDGKIDDYAD
jgi:AGCS family alanine or glycine:cation symporter